MVLTLIPEDGVYSVSLVCLSMKGYGDYYVVNVTNCSKADEREEFTNPDDAMRYYQSKLKEAIG